MSPTRVKAFAVALAACALASVSSQRAAGQNTSPPSAQDAAQLRRSLAAAFGGDFEFVKDELPRGSNGHGSGLWLVHVKPKRSGHFKLTYKYRYVDRVKPKDPLYEFVEHEIPIWVGEKGCRRRVQDRNYTDVCLGDTVILPFVLNGYTGHTFSLESREYQPDDDSHKESSRLETAGRAEADKRLYSEPVANPAAEFLKYVGSSAYYSPHRGQGFTMSFNATFEALKPGSFNLSLGARVTGDLPLGLTSGGVGVPVIIVERGAPLTVLASGEYVRSYGERFSSGTGNGYLTTPLVMQPGDRITLQFHGYSVRGFRSKARAEADPRMAVKQVAPVIRMLPFYVDPEDGFNHLMVDHLPVRNPPKAP